MAVKMYSVTAPIVRNNRQRIQHQHIIIPASNFTLHGTPKHYSYCRGYVTHTTTFCGDCGTTVAKTVDGFEKFKGLLLVKAGTLNDGQGFRDMKLDADVFVKTRVELLKGIEGLKQVEMVL